MRIAAAVMVAVLWLGASVLHVAASAAQEADSAAPERQPAPVEPAVKPAQPTAAPAPEMEAPAAGVPLPVGAPAAQPQAGPGTGQNVVVHLSHYTDDLHAVQMALTVANSLRSQGAGVTLLLDQEGARAADKRQPVGLRWGLSGSFDEAYDAFVKAGGKVLVCPHCAAVVDLEERVLRPGAAIADDEAEFTAVILGADKVVDY